MVKKAINQEKFLEEVIIPKNTELRGCEAVNACYLPAVVAIQSGGEVIWTNEDTVAHTVTSGTPQSGPDGLFDSGLISPESSFSVGIQIPGNYDYYCVAHPWQTGVVSVVASN